MFFIGLFAVVVLCVVLIVILRRIQLRSGILRTSLFLLSGLLFFIAFSWLSIALISQKGSAAFEISRLPVHMFHLRNIDIQADIQKIKYGDHQRQYIDLLIYPDSLDNTKPAIFYVHGGGWTVGKPDQDYYLADWLAQKGHAVYLCAYRLAPKHNSYDLNEDISLGFHTAYRHCVDSLSLPPPKTHPRKWIIGGTSAGSNLSALLCYDNNRWNNIKPRDSLLLGYFAMSGVLDLNKISDNMVVRGYCGKRNSPMFQQSNPLNFVDSTDHFPILVIHGSQDGLAPLDNILQFTARLDAFNLPYSLFVVDSATHLETCTAWYYDSKFNNGQDSVILHWLSSL